MVEVEYIAARADLESIMNLLLNPLWSRSWQMAPTHRPRHSYGVKISGEAWPQ